MLVHKVTVLLTTWRFLHVLSTKNECRSGLFASNPTLDREALMAETRCAGLGFKPMPARLTVPFLILVTNARVEKNHAGAQSGK